MPVYFTDGRKGLMLISKEYEGAMSLMHYRVGGEKRGIRRWQDKLGHLTTAGYLHYKEIYGWGKGRKKGAEEDSAEETPQTKEEKKVRGPSSEDSKHRMQGEFGDADYPTESSRQVLKALDIPVESLGELKRIGKNDDISEIRKDINHRTEEELKEVAGTILSDTGRHYNCPNCACAFELVERGYDVTARRALDGSNVGDIERYFKGGKLEQAAYSDWEDDPRRLNAPSKKRERRKWDKWYQEYSECLGEAREEAVSKLTEALEKQGAGARGIIVVGWLMEYNTSPTTQFHALNYKIENDGYLTLYDTQSYRKCNGAPDTGMLYGCDPRELHYMRTDILDIDDSITKTVYSRGRCDA